MSIPPVCYFSFQNNWTTLNDIRYIEICQAGVLFRVFWCAIGKDTLINFRVKVHNFTLSKFKWRYRYFVATTARQMT